METDARTLMAQKLDSIIELQNSQATERKLSALRELADYELERIMRAMLSYGNASTQL